jgi:phage-related protein
VLIIANGSSSRTVTIDVEAMNAYNGNTLLNRIVSGDYSDLTLPVGKNLIQWTGSVSSFKIDKYSRWV